MITYETLRKLAWGLSKATRYRYIAFCESPTANLLICFSNTKMKQHHQSRLWCGESTISALEVGDFPDLPFLDWSQCQFDCEEEEE